MPHVPPTDGEKLSGVTEGRGVRAALSTQRAEDSSESREEEQVVSRAVGKNTCVRHTHVPEATSVPVASGPVGWVDGGRGCRHGAQPSLQFTSGGHGCTSVPASACLGRCGEGPLGVCGWGTMGSGLYGWMCAGESL